MKPYAPSQKAFARNLRSHLTDAEQKFWQHLRRKQILGLQFYRQKPIGPYIVDFYCPGVQLVIELDGAQHMEPEHLQKDQQRDTDLAKQGIQTLRFDDRQVLLETEAVLQFIWNTISKRIASS